MPTLIDIAKAANVSPSTASLVLNKRPGRKTASSKATQAVLQAARELGYVPNYHARSMKTGRAQAIALALHTDPAATISDTRLGNQYFGSLVGGVEIVLARAGYSMIVVPSEPNLLAPDRAIAMLRQRQVDGVVAVGVTHDTNTRSLFMQQPPTEAEPVVVLQPPPSGLPGHYGRVSWDEPEGVRLAINHLIELGHREMLWLAPHGGRLQSPALREQLVMQTGWDLGIHGGGRVHFDDPNFDDPTLDGSSDSGHTVAETTAAAADAALRRHLALKDRPLFTAVLCYNDITAAGALRALRAAKMNVPEDVSVVAFDDLQAAYLDPPLTSVNQMLVQMGRRAGGMLLDALEADDPLNAIAELNERRDVITPEIVIRQSTSFAKR
jgi:LacI family transcriptional regulator